MHHDLLSKDVTVNKRGRDIKQVQAPPQFIDIPQD